MSEFSYVAFSFPGRLTMVASINGGGGHLGESALTQDAEVLLFTQGAQWAQSGHLGAGTGGEGLQGNAPNSGLDHRLRSLEQIG